MFDSLNVAKTENIGARRESHLYCTIPHMFVIYLAAISVLTRLFLTKSNSSKHAEQPRQNLHRSLAKNSSCSVFMLLLQICPQLITYTSLGTVGITVVAGHPKILPKQNTFYVPGSIRISLGKSIWFVITFIIAN